MSRNMEGSFGGPRSDKAIAQAREVPSIRSQDRPARITGLSHVTLATRDLDRAVVFYREVLGMRLCCHWPQGAYLDAGSLWLCLSLDAQARTEPHPDYTHLAFQVEPGNFGELSRRVEAAAPLWKENRSEGASLYCLDPDGHKLELHVGTLASRLAHYRANPVEDRWVVTDEAEGGAPI